jgi:hypothetical protein
MVEAGSHFKLLPPSMLDMYIVSEHIAMLSIGIQYQPYTDAHILGLWVTCGVNLM